MFHFADDVEGYAAFTCWVNVFEAQYKAEKVIVGFEPTGHYWFNFGRYVKKLGMMLVLVNLYHVKQIKDLDDNSPKKTDYNRKAGGRWTVLDSIYPRRGLR